MQPRQSHRPHQSHHARRSEIKQIANVGGYPSPPRTRAAQAARPFSPFSPFALLALVAVLAAAILLVLAAMRGCSDEGSPSAIDQEIPSETLAVSDTALEERYGNLAARYQFDPAQDMQLPELPTGCEATALATLLRIHGVEVTKTEVADAMPKGTDWVNCFWGDPYEPTGWACMPPCSVNVANGFLAGTGKTATEYKGAALADLPLPCAAWVSIDMADPLPSRYEKDGYHLFQNTHCLVILSVEEDSVQVIDPLQGCVSYDRATFERVYETLGAQAVYIA